MAERTIDRALRIAKSRHNMHQRQFADALDKAGLPGTLPQHVTNWKRRGLPPEHLQVVAKVLRVTVDELLGAAAVATPSTGPELTAREIALIDAYRAASDEVKRAIEGAAFGAPPQEPPSAKGWRRDIIENRPINSAKKRARKRIG